MRLRQLFVIFILGLAAHETSAQVTVTGGRDPVEVNFYRWTVTNQGNKPIDRFEFPRYMVDDLGSPDGWSHQIVKTDAAGRSIEPHRIVYKADRPSTALRRGESAVFEAQINIDKATPGRQPVLVGFADGTTLEIADIEVPWDYPWLEKHALLIGMGTLFAIFLLVQMVRSRKPKSTAPTAA